MDITDEFDGDPDGPVEVEAEGGAVAEVTDGGVVRDDRVEDPGVSTPEGPVLPQEERP